MVQQVYVPWQNDPIEFDDDVSPEDMAEGIKHHPNYPGDWEQTLAPIAKNVGGAMGVVSEQMPFVGQNIENPPGHMDWKHMKWSEEPTQTQIQNKQALEEFKSEHPNYVPYLEGAGKIIGAAPALAAAEVTGGGSLPATMGAFGVQDLLDKLAKRGTDALSKTEIGNSAMTGVEQGVGGKVLEGLSGPALKLAQSVKNSAVNSGRGRSAINLLGAMLSAKFGGGWLEGLFGTEMLQNALRGSEKLAPNLAEEAASDGSVMSAKNAILRALAAGTGSQLTTPEYAGSRRGGLSFGQ